MTTIDLIVWAAAGMTLTAFTSRDVRLLRLASLGASVAFITYGLATSTWPVLALHSVLLPVNLFRLMELRKDRPRSDDTDDQASPPNACKCGRTLATRSKPRHRLALLALGLVPVATPMAAPPTYAERMHARAVESFRQGRFPEAYGRFIELANAGHPASARYAHWMCEQGPTLFGKNWDCASHELEDWARAAGVVSPPIAKRHDMTPTSWTLPLRR